MKNNHNIKSIVLFLILLALVGMAKAQQWQGLQTGVTEDLYNICCIDANTVFVCGQNGVILKSIDGGISWEEKYRRTGYQMTELCFAEPNVGYAVCDSTLDDYSHQWFLVKTFDGGETWNEVGIPVFSWIESFTALGNQFIRTEMVLNDADNLVVAVSFDGIYKSTDGGQTMSKLSNDFTINETRGFFFEDNVGYLLWDYANEDFAFPGERYPGVAKTEDYGETWALVENVSDVTYSMGFARFYDKDHIRLFGGFIISEYDYKGVLETYDGFDTFGTTGNYYDFQYSEVYIRAKFTGNSQGMCMLWEYDMPGVGRSVAYTEDDGLTWTSYSGYSLPSYRFYDIDGVDTTFFISCANGMVLKNRQFTLMGTEENSSLEVTVYPNPAKEKIVIEGTKIAEVQVYNAFGQLVKTVQGKNEINVSDLPDGIYLLHMTDKEGLSLSKRISVFGCQ